MRIVITPHANDQIRRRMAGMFTARDVQTALQGIAEGLQDRSETHVVLAKLDAPAHAEDGSQGDTVVAACHRKGRKVVVATVMYRWARQLRR